MSTLMRLAAVLPLPVVVMDGGDGTADIVGDTINLTAETGGIGPIEVTASTELNADTDIAGAGDGSAIDIDSIGDLSIGLVSTGVSGNRVTLNSTGNINDGTVAEAANIIGSEAILAAQTGIGSDISGEDIDTTIVNLTATTTDGSIFIEETDAVTLNNITAIGTGGSIDFKNNSGNITLDGNIWAKDSIVLEAANEMLYSSGNIKVTGSSLTLKQDASIDLATFAFDNQTGTDLTMESFNGSVTADTTAPANAADKWKSITATAQGPALSGYVALTGTGTSDVTTKALTATNGSVSVNAAGKKIIAQGDMTGVGIYLGNNVTANGSGTQEFDALAGTLTAKGAITKTGGGLKLNGALVNLDGIDGVTGDSVNVTGGGLTVTADSIGVEGNLEATGLVDLQGSTKLAGDVTGDGITFNNDVKADGAGLQTFDAKAGDLIANGTLEKPTGPLALNSGGYINVVGSAVATSGSLSATAGGNITVGGDVIAGGSMTHSGNNITINGITDSGNWMKLTADDNITLGGATKAGGAMTLTADDNTDGTGKVWAKSTLTTTAGNIDIQASDTTIVLGGNVDAAADLLLNSNTVVEAGKTLKAGDDVTLADDKTLTGAGSLAVQAGDDITLGGEVHTNNNLKVEAGQDVVVKGELTADNGGVSLIANNGTVSTDGSILNVPITGFSDGTKGVELESGSGQRAAIVIKSGENLELGTAAVLSANGVYDTPDNRSSIAFKHDATPNAGFPIDVSIYLQSVDGSIRVDSEKIVGGTDGTVVFDAHHQVAFADTFEGSIQGPPSDSQISRIEVVSRISGTENAAMTTDGPFGGPRLPHAGETTIVGWNLLDKDKESAYVLRGDAIGAVIQDNAFVLDFVEAVPLMSFGLVPPEIEPGEVESVDLDELFAWLESEFGKDAKIFFAGAYNNEYSTDLLPIKSALRLRELSRILGDYKNYIAALTQAVNEFAPDPEMPPSEEQFDAASQVIAMHFNADDGTHYAVAGEWLNAIAEYFSILTNVTGTGNYPEYTEIGWDSDRALLQHILPRYFAGAQENVVGYIGTYILGGS